MPPSFNHPLAGDGRYEGRTARYSCVFRFNSDRRLQFGCVYWRESGSIPEQSTIRAVGKVPPLAGKAGSMPVTSINLGANSNQKIHLLNENKMAPSQFKIPTATYIQKTALQMQKKKVSCFCARDRMAEGTSLLS